MTLKTALRTVAAAAILAIPAATASAQSEGTVGDCMSDFIYGNEPNMANGAPGGPEEQAPGSQAGNVLPSQSPGPFVTNQTTGEVTRGSSIGEFHQEFGGGAVAEFCKVYSETA
jgi:hypothetical protein